MRPSTPSSPAHWPFFQHVHELYDQCGLGRLNDLNPSMGRVTRLTPRWSCSMMLLRMLDLADFDQRPVLLFVVIDGHGVVLAAIDRDLLRHAVAANAFFRNRRAAS